jgi:undecaprenyl-diphosphatase
MTREPEVLKSSPAGVPIGLRLPGRLQRRLDPNERYGLRLTLVACAVLIVAIPFAYLVCEVVGGGPLTRLDARVANALNAWSHTRPNVVHLLEGVSMVSKPVTLWVVVTGAAILLLRAGRRRVAVFVVVTSLGGGIIDSLVKLAVNRTRPVVDHPVATAFGKSFPSGHTMSATVVYGALLVACWPLLSRGWRRLALGATIVLVMSIGSSRMLLGLHFLSDVVGGFLLGLAWLSGSTAAFQTWRHDVAVADRRDVNETDDDSRFDGAGDETIAPTAR